MPDVERRRSRSGDLLLAILIPLAIGSAPAVGGIFSAADELLAAGEAEEARAELRRIADEHEGSALGNEALFRWNELEPDGPVYLERLARLADRWDDPRAWFALGRYRFAVGAYRAAADDFGKAARLLAGEEKMDASCWRGLALVAAGEVDSGIQLLLGTAENGRDAPPAIRARYLAAEALSRKGSLDRAASVLKPLLAGRHDFSAPALLLKARLEGADTREDRAAAGSGETPRRAPEEVAAEAAAPPAPPPRDTILAVYYVQIASFEDESNARRFVAGERARGVGAIDVYPSGGEGRVLYRVRVGPFATPEEAQTAREHLSRQGLGGDIVRALPEDE
ncbi:MAG: SPOR domain-containing protein [Candidatus Eisenbacteria bacterium]|nr:SPOR domain-containing protein [Candidatus Eisenbacteria bacterium]